MTDTSPDPELARELEVLLKKSGLVVPEDRYQAVLAGYKDLRRMAALLRRPRTAAAEPAGTYSLATLMRKA